MRNQTELVALLTNLVCIDSVNPDLIVGAKGEDAIAAFITTWATRAGLEAIVQPVEPGRSNVIVVARGLGGGKTLMLNGHIDTVGIDGMEAPLSAHIEGNRLYGRGAYDMKASIAASLLAAKQAKSLNLRGDVIVSCVADEEVASKGTQAVIQELHRWQPDAVIVTEPTEMQLAVAHKGFAWFTIETFGVAAHGSRPDLGVDAIAKMGRVLAALERYDYDLRANPTHPYLGSGSIHASIIQGGQEMSSYPAYCRLQLERRFVPGELVADIHAQLQTILDQCTNDDNTFRATITPGLSRNAFEAPENMPIVQICQRHLGETTGCPAKLGGVSYWADSALFSAAGVPTVLLGPTGFGAHASVEWVDLDSVQHCADIYTAVAQRFCQ